jgi:hypothetical protein
VLQHRSAHLSAQERPPNEATGRLNHQRTLQDRFNGALIDILENGCGADTDSTTQNLREGAEVGTTSSCTIKATKAWAWPPR